MKFEDVVYYVEDAFQKAGYDFGYFNIDVKINSRLTHTLGRCLSRDINGVCDPYEIQLSKKLFENGTDESIKNVIYHEAAHAISIIETGEYQGHNAIFKAICHRIGTPFDKMKADVEWIKDKEELYKYTVYCEKCGKVVKRYNRAGKVVKEPQHYFSKCCNAGLRVVQNF